jgi:MFS transporter, UMF1 family
MKSALRAEARPRDVWAWAMFDFANSGYTTVVVTALFNAYFVAVVAGGAPWATLAWTAALAVSYLAILITAPIVGAYADRRAAKKRLLALSTAGCVLFTALLYFAQADTLWLAVACLILSNFFFGTGENLIAAFLPEIATPRNIGRISGYGWSLGYLGGLLVLGLCLGYVAVAEARGDSAEQFVPVTMLITAAAFALAALPTFLWLRERAVPQPRVPGHGYVYAGFRRLRETLIHAYRYPDLFRFLLTLSVYQCGVYAVIVLAAVYAQQVMAFSTRDTIVLILVVNVTAAVGAFAFGHVQDRIGSVRTLALTLLVWTAALTVAYGAEERAAFWVAANLIGVALGSSQSAGRALIGLFAPPSRNAEFFGLWGLAAKLAAIVGPMAYGGIAYASGGNHRLAVLATAGFFVAGLALLLTVDEKRGQAAARGAA